MKRTVIPLLLSIGIILSGCRAASGSSLSSADTALPDTRDSVYICMEIV